MEQKYKHIVAMIKQARAAGNEKQVKFWMKRLNTWQLAYGAYAPIK